jgi:hypothetical protein
MMATAVTQTPTTRIPDTVVNRIPEDLPTPLYAVMGVADAAAHEARQVPTRLETVRKDVETSTHAVRDDLTKRVEGMREQLTARATEVQHKTVGDKSFAEAVQQLPETLRAQLTEYTAAVSARVETLPADTRALYLDVVDEARKQYDAFALRGEKLVTTIRTSEETVVAEKQVKSAVSKTKAAQTTARKATAQTTRARKAAATSARKAGEDVVIAAEAAAEKIGK